MALVGEMQYLTIGSNTYSLPSGGGGSTIGYVEYDVTTYDEAVQIIEDNDIVYCKIVNVINEGESNEFTRTEYAPLVFFDDGYEYMTFSYVSQTSKNPYDDDTITAVDISLDSDNNWVWDYGTTSNNQSKCFYGTCSTSASTTAKVVSSSNFYPIAGNIIGILFTTGNTAATPTLNINGTGSESIYVGNSTPNATTNVLKWSANTMVYFMYDGSYYRYITSVAAGSVEQPRGANVWYGTSSTAADTAAKTSTIANYVLTKGAVVNITFTTANTADVLTLNVNSTGAKAIYYNNAATSSSNKLTWNANETVTFVYTGSYYYFLEGKDEKLKVGTIVSNTDYSPVCMTSVGTIPRTSTALLMDEFRITKNTNDGVTNLIIGSSQGQRGQIKLGYRVDGNNYYTTTLTTSHTNTNRTITLPDATGTVALTSDIPDVSGKIDTAGTGLSKSGTTLNHSNSVTAQTTQAVYPIKIDAQGHISEYGTATTVPKIGFVDENSSLSTVISTCEANDFVFYVTDDDPEYYYAPLIDYGANEGYEWARFGAVIPDVNPEILGASSGWIYYIDANSNGWVEKDAWLFTPRDYVTYNSTSYATALERLENCDVLYCKYVTGTSPNQVTYYCPLTYFNDTYDYMLFAVPFIDTSSNKTKIKTLTLAKSGNSFTWSEDTEVAPTITLNGSTTTSPSFYAPTSAGTSGYVLTSAGSGAPSWTSGELTDTKNTAGSTNSTNKIYLIGAESQAANPQTYSNEYLYFNKGLTSIAPLNSNNINSSISQNSTGILLSVLDRNNDYNSALNLSSTMAAIAIDNYAEAYRLSVNTSGDIYAECLEFKIELDSTSDATLMSDISSLGWTNDVIA